MMHAIFAQFYRHARKADGYDLTRSEPQGIDGLHEGGAEGGSDGL